MLQVKALTYLNQQNSPLFSDLSFRVEAGRLILVMGQNGSGKSTLLKILCDLISPTQGTIYWQGKPLQKNRLQFYQDLFYLGHQNSLQKSLTLTENIVFLDRLSGRYGDFPKTRFEAVLKQFDLWEQRHMPIKVLSCGQQRRSALLPLWLNFFKLWILDEPVTGLDQTSQALFSEQLKKHLSNKGMAIMATHDSNRHLSDQIIQLGV